MTRWKCWCATCGKSFIVTNETQANDFRAAGDSRHDCPEGEAQTGVTAL